VTDAVLTLLAAGGASDGSALQAAVVPMAPDAPVGALLLLAVLGVLAAALLSAGEAALSRLTRTAAADLVASGRRGARAVQRLTERPVRAAEASTYVRLLAEMTAAACITLAVASSLSAWWHVLGVALGVTAVLLTLVVGASPRGLGRRKPVQVLTLVAPVMLGLSALAAPVERFRLWERSGRTAREEAEDAAGELRDMVERVSESEQIEEDEREMLQSVFELGRTLTREVMVPRTTMVTLTSSATVAKALRLFVRSGYSRVPVIGDSEDDVVGVLYLKDVLGRMQFHPEAGDEPVTRLVRTPVYVPETKPVDDLMREMQQSSTHMALVVDEFGGIAGLVTIEDCLEEIVGELRDEHDRREPDVEELPDGSYRVPARIAVDELGELFGLELHDDEVDSAGGLLAKALGKVPIPGAAAEVQGLLLTAERTEGRRRQVATLIVHRLEPEEVEEGENLTDDTSTRELRPVTYAQAQPVGGAENRAGKSGDTRRAKNGENRATKKADTQAALDGEVRAAKKRESATKDAQGRGAKKAASPTKDAQDGAGKAAKTAGAADPSAGGSAGAAASPRSDDETGRDS
jgi:CBS domain containing-hemolysin-like protein